MNIKTVVHSINWKLLREQKHTLIGVFADADIGTEKKVHLGGLLNLIDSIQDSAVEEEIASEEEVFGVIEEGGGIMKDKEDLALALRQFTGTDRYYRHWLVKKMLYTDGVKFFAEEAGGGAYWFLDIVATEIFGLLEANPFLSIKLISENGKPTIVVEDGNNNVLFKRDDIEYTDCPEGTWLFFMSDNVMLLPSEN